MQSSSNGYRAVIFDLDGTLRLNDPPALETFYQIAAELGFKTDSEQQRVGERWVNEYWADSDDLKQDIDRYGHHKDNSAFWENHARRHLLQIGAPRDLVQNLVEQITQRMREEYQPQDVVPESVFPTLRTLKETGLKLGMLSNRSQPMNELVDALGLSEHFELILAAGEVGWFKPDPRVFHYVADQLRIEPELSIYVGDNYHADVLGARAAGMTPVLVDPRGVYHDADCLVIGEVGEIHSALLRAGA